VFTPVLVDLGPIAGDEFDEAGVLLEDDDSLLGIAGEFGGFLVGLAQGEIASM